MTKSWILVMLLVLLIGGSGLSQRFQFVKSENGYLLKENDKPVYFYQEKTKSKDGQYPRANYIHPLYGLTGEVLTEDFPADHLHQRGIFWAWHQLFVKGLRVGDPWECRGIRWNVGKVETTIQHDLARLQATVLWEGLLPGEADSSVFLKERSIITAYTSEGKFREIDLEIQLTAVHDGTKLGGSEDEKGYGGFSARLVLPEDVKFYSKSGEVQPVNTAIQSGGWIDVRASFNPETKPSGVLIMCNPEKPKPFQGWIIRKKGSMQNPAFPGRDPIVLPVNKTLVLKYKVLIHSDNLAPTLIDSIYSDFLKTE